jgi:hypothetical protein
MRTRIVELPAGPVPCSIALELPARCRRQLKAATGESIATVARAPETVGVSGGVTLR